MLACLALAALTLRSGLHLRRARLHGGGGASVSAAAARRGHVSLAKCTLALLWPGFFGGLASALWLRGWDALATLHGALACAALCAFTATAMLGRRLLRGGDGDDGGAAAHARRREWHGRLALLSLLAALAAFGAGFVLLP